MRGWLYPTCPFLLCFERFCISPCMYSANSLIMHLIIFIRYAALAPYCSFHGSNVCHVRLITYPQRHQDTRIASSRGHQMGITIPFLSAWARQVRARSVAVGFQLSYDCLVEAQRNQFHPGSQNDASDAEGYWRGTRNDILGKTR